MYTQAHNTVTVPYTAKRSDASYLVKLQTLKRFEFTSQSMKSGTIAVPEDESDDTAVLFLKGAPFVIQNLADAATIPVNFTKVRMCRNNIVLSCFWQAAFKHIPVCIGLGKTSLVKQLVFVLGAHHDQLLP